MTVVVCWKWVAPDGDARWGGVSHADRAALEIGLQLAAISSSHVAVVSLGPTGAEHALREALAVGATRVVRIEAPAELRSDAVAASIARVAGRPDWVVCGDVSPDRGSGSVPATIAAELGMAQALGLVGVELPSEPGGAVGALRRLDGGRREELLVRAPAVLSVEGAVATLRRASLTGELAARTAPIDVELGPDGPLDAPLLVGPYRPRARVLPSPEGASALERVRALVGTGESTHGELVTLDPPAAARRILDALATWGYVTSGLALEEDVAGGGG